MEKHAHFRASDIVGGIANDVEVKPEIILPCRHIVAHELDIWMRDEYGPICGILRELTKTLFRLRNMSIGSNSFVLTVNEDPKPDLALRLLEILSNTRFELQVWLGFKDTESRQLCRRPVLVIESGKIEPLMSLEGLVRDHLSCEEKVLFVTFSFFSLL
jgi:hypothetical protein